MFWFGVGLGVCGFDLGVFFFYIFHNWVDLSREIDMFSCHFFCFILRLLLLFINKIAAVENGCSSFPCFFLCKIVILGRLLI